MIVKCLLCTKEYDIDSKDHQYLRLLRKETKHYICKSCNKDTKKEAQDASGIDPEVIDKFEKMDRA